MSRALMTRREPAVYRRLFVPLVPDGDNNELIVAEACLIAADGGAVVVLVPLEVPLRLPLETPLPDAEEQARATVKRARGVADRYGIDVRSRIVRTRGAGPTIVEEAERAHADAIVVRMRRGGRLDPIAEFVVRHASCRVLIAAG